jgi:hypothetical protein
MSTVSLNPEQRRLLSIFVREYEYARDHAEQAAAVRDAAYQRLLRASQLALGGQADLTLDFITWEVQAQEEARQELDSYCRAHDVRFDSLEGCPVCEKVTSSDTEVNYDEKLL